MKTYLDCIPCFIRQALEVSRLVTDDTAVHEQLVREVLQWSEDLDFQLSPPVIGQRIHRRLREISGIEDPYLEIKNRLNSLALALESELEAEVIRAEDPMLMAAKLAIAGNIIDLGVTASITESDIRKAIDKALATPFEGDMNVFREAILNAKDILYLADNTGEIVFDKLLIKQLQPERVTLAVRGGPIINDATYADAEAVGLVEMVRVIDNGSDAPGTVLTDCSAEFCQRFAAADLIIAKGQGNFETLSEAVGNIFFLFQAKCPVIADHAGHPVGTHILSQHLSV